MNTYQSTLLLLVPAVALMSWAVCSWWHRRKLLAYQQRIEKLCGERETLQEQVKQTRHQLAQLHKEMARRMADAAAQRARAIKQQPADDKPSIKARLDIPSGLVFETPQSPAHGFADTMPFEEATTA